MISLPAGATSGPGMLCRAIERRIRLTAPGRSCRSCAAFWSSHFSVHSLHLSPFTAASGAPSSCLSLPHAWCLQYPIVGTARSAFLQPANNTSHRQRAPQCIARLPTGYVAQLPAHCYILDRHSRRVQTCVIQRSRLLVPSAQSRPGTTWQPSRAESTGSRAAHLHLCATFSRPQHPTAYTSNITAICPLLSNSPMPRPAETLSC